MEGKGEIVIYQAQDGQASIDVRLENDTVWLRQEQLAELFDRDRTVITKHINNIFNDKELDRESKVQNLHIANSDKPVTFYNLEVIISVGYRVKSPRGTQFRIWANTILKDYLVRGYAVNEKRLKEKSRQLATTLLLSLLTSKVRDGLSIITIHSTSRSKPNTSIVSFQYPKKEFFC